MSGFSPNPSQARVIQCRDQLCVIAGAGSGKTGTLVAAIIERLAEGDDPLSIQNLLALTFTEKAAAELRWRLGRAFSQRALDNPEEETHWRAQAGLLDRADIGTIHGYALKLVRENAIGLGLSARLAIDGSPLTLARDFQNVVTDWLDENDPDFTALLPVIPAADLKKILTLCADRQGSWGLGRLLAETKASGPAPAKLESFRHLARRALDLVENGDLNKSKPYYARVLECVTLLNQTLVTANDDDLGQRITMWARLIKNSGNWCSKLGRPMKRELEAAVQSLKADYDNQVAGPIKARLLKLAHQIPRRLDQQKKKRGVINFDDILLLARRLLAQNPQVRQKEIARRRLIMIDEFQDTNRLQANLLAYLLLDPEDGRVFPEDHDLWREMDWPRAAPRLSVFGDLKQSIYRFRGAEVEVMAGLRQALLGGSGQVLALDCNYRSQGPLIDFFNALFEHTLGPNGFSEHDRQKPSRPPLYGGPQAALLIPGPDRPSRSIARAEAQAGALVRYLGDLFSGAAGVMIDGPQGVRPPGPGDVAVLFRQSTRAGLFREKLLKAGWKCQTAFGDNPFSYAEVKALLAAFKYLGGVDEEVSLAAALRSPLGPVSDAALLALARPAEEAGAVPLADYFSGRRPWPPLPADDGKTLAELKDLFGRLTPLMGRSPAVEILERLAEERRLIPLALLEPDGAERARAITAFLAASRAVGAQGDHLPLGAAEELAEMADGWEDRGGDEGTDPEAIKLMTVHGSKGLEFPVVIVAEADRTEGGRFTPAVISREGYFAVRYRDENGTEVKPADYLRLKEEEEAGERQEEGRLLYVAATRAKDHLAFIGWPRKNVKPGARLSWFETVAGCQAAAHLVTTIEYDGQEDTHQSAARPPSPAKPIEGPHWPLDLLGPMETTNQALAVTALSDLLVAPDRFFDEHHLKINGDWRPGCGRPFFDEKPPGPDEATWPERATGDPFFLEADQGPGCPKARPTPGPLPAKEAGTLFHAVLEKVDLENPQIPVLLRQEAQLMNLAPTADDLARLTLALETFLAGPVGAPWRDSFKNGLEFRELPFILTVPGPPGRGVLHVKGRMDLFYQTADGEGRIVDYKFSAPKDGPELAAYEIQLRAYGQALRAWGIQGPLKAALYFAGGPKPVIHEVELAHPDPLAPHLARLYQLWPQLMATRPLRPNRPGTCLGY